MVQTKSKPTIEEINSCLFGDEEEKKNSSDSSAPQPRLLKQRGLSSDELESVPYYKKPGVQIAVLIAVAFPFTWGLVSAFFPKETNPQSQSANDPQDKENQLLKQSLEQERKKNQDLAIEKGLRTQQIEVIRVKQPQTTSLPPKPTPKPVAVQPRPISVPPRPRTIYVPVPAKASVPVQKPTVTKPDIPEIDPMEQWLAQANQGHYIAVADNSANSSNAQNAVYTSNGQDLQASSVNDVPGTSSIGAESNSADIETNNSDSSSLAGAQSDRSELTELYSSRAANRSQLEEMSSTQIQEDEMNNLRRRNSNVSSPNGYNAQNVSDTNSSISSYSNQSLSQRAIPNPVPLNSEDNIYRNDATRTSANNSSQQNEGRVFQDEAEATSVEQVERFLDIGSSAEAELQTGIAWTEQGLQQNRNYLLRLEEGFKNGMGQEVLPSGTRLIVRVTETSNSGLFSAEVTHILLGSGRERISVPSGVMQLVSDDGSPLKADLKRKGGPGFLETVGTIVAPGVEKAMGSLADGADSLILEDGDRSLIQTSGGDDNPVAAGLSGVATGASRVFSNQLQSRQNQQSAPYFQFDSGETVRVMVNEDFSL